MASIPNHIIFDILIRLPVKSLARFKALNKLYSSFIEDPQFIYTHSKNGASRADKNRLILSYIEHRNLNTTIHFVAFKVVDNPELAVVEYSATVSFGSYHILPPCNGLVCFYGLHGDVYVCNPSTKQVARLPNIDAQGSRSLSCGFGFDEISGKHKVIRFMEHRIGIFSMGDDCWRSMRYIDPGFEFQYHGPAVFSGGFFYWITYDHVDFRSGFSIVSFDIGKEVLESISPPESISGKNWYNMYMVELGGELWLVDLDYESEEDKRRMETWILRRNKVEKNGNWVRGETIVHRSEPIDTTRPVAFNGVEILLHGCIKGLGHLNCYNVHTGGFRELMIKGIPSEFFHVNHYVESLFPVEQ